MNFLTVDYHIGATYEKDGQYCVDRKKFKGEGWITIYTGTKKGCEKAVARDSKKISDKQNVNVLSKVYEV